MVLLIDWMCGLSHDDLWVQVGQRWCCDSWSSQRRKSRDAEHVVVEAQDRVGDFWCNRWPSGYSGTRENGQVYGSKKAWPIWSFVTRTYAGAIDRDLSSDATNAEITTDVVDNEQLGGVKLYVVLIMLCTRRALDCAVSAVYRWGMEVWRMFCRACSLWNDARLGVLMIEVLAACRHNNSRTCFLRG